MDDNLINETVESVGETVRELRQLRKMSVRTLAARIDRSPAFVSQLERNISRPSLKDIYAIAGVLDRPVGYFLQGAPSGPAEEKGHVVRKQFRRRMEVNGIITEILSPKLGEGIDFNQTTFLPLAKTESQKYDQNGYETGVLISGALEMNFEGKKFHLNEGDSYSFRLNELHYSFNPSSDTTAVLIWTVTYVD